MTAERATRRRTRKLHIGDKAVIDHLVRGISAGKSGSVGRVHDAVTASGLLVEEQVRKAWDRTLVGLAMF